MCLNSWFYFVFPKVFNFKFSISPSARFQLDIHKNLFMYHPENNVADGEKWKFEKFMNKEDMFGLFLAILDSILISGVKYKIWQNSQCPNELLKLYSIIMLK